MALKASISGIRGIVGESLTPPIIVDYLSAFSQVIGEGPILLGMDPRPSGENIMMLVKSVLNAMGRDVVEIGVVPTPTVLFGVGQGGFAGGIVVTASHNPIEWNALKLVNGEGKFISPAQFKELSAAYEGKDFSYVGYEGIGSSKSDATIPAAQISKICSFVKSAKIREKRFKVALDTVNGAGGRHTIKLLEELGCEVLPINTEETGRFAHPPEPTPANLSELSALIKEKGADVGFALDPDGDRLVVASESGEILSEELTLALCCDHYLKSYGKSELVINLSTSRVNEDVADKHGVKLHRVPTGEIHVTEELERLGAAIGGEGNGGIIMMELNKCRDASVGIALVLDYLAESGHKLSEIAAGYPVYAMVKKKFPISELDFSTIEERIRLEFKNSKVDNQDGLRVEIGKDWVLVRKSNTEPIVRIFAESESEERANALIEQVKKLVGIE